MDSSTQQQAEQKPAAALAALRIDLHCHTEASHDCVTPLTQIPARLIAKGIHVQAITDHDQIWGAQELKRMVLANPEWSERLMIIVGEEISTSEGEIIGLFLNELIPPGLSPEKTIEEIKRQGGLVSIPHGFDPLKRHRLHAAARERLASEINIIETFNARISNRHWNREAEKWARTHGKQLAAGSDSHRWADLGCCASESEWPGKPLPVEVEGEAVRTAASATPRPALPFDGAPGFTRRVDSPEDLMAALSISKINGKWTHPVLAFVLKASYWVSHKARRLLRA